jgi:hypothetical protein
VCLAVPELTRSAGIQLNKRVSLRGAVAIVSSSQSRGVPKAMPPLTARSGVAALAKWERPPRPNAADVQ